MKKNKYYKILLYHGVSNYYNYKGVKKATDEFLIGKHHDVEYSRITSRVTIYK